MPVPVASLARGARPLVSLVRFHESQGGVPLVRPVGGSLAGPVASEEGDRPASKE